MKRLLLVTILLMLLVGCGKKEGLSVVNITQENEVDVNLSISEGYSSIDIPLKNSTGKVIKVKDIKIEETDWEVVAFNQDMSTVEVGAKNYQ